MFRKIKKLYFKIYHLFKLIGVFLVIFGLCDKVYAEECTNLIVNGQDWIKQSAGNFILNGTGTTNRYTTLEPLTNYTIFFDYGEENFNEIINLSTAVRSFQIWQRWGGGFSAIETISDLTVKKYTFQTQEDKGNNNLQYYFRMNGISGNTDTTPFIDNKEHEFWLVKGTEVCRVKPEPEPEDNVYSGFLTIYFDRITYLAEGFTNNPYLIAMIGIIFGFVVLDLLLKIINIRRKK